MRVKFLGVRLLLLIAENVTNDNRSSKYLSRARNRGGVNILIRSALYSENTAKNHTKCCDIAKISTVQKGNRGRRF